MSSQDTDTSSEISQTSLTEKKRDIETQIAWVQSQLHHLRREGQYRVQESTGRVLKYRPD